MERASIMVLLLLLDLFSHTIWIVIGSLSQSASGTTCCTYLQKANWDQIYMSAYAYASTCIFVAFCVLKWNGHFLCLWQNKVKTLSFETICHWLTMQKKRRKVKGVGGWRCLLMHMGTPLWLPYRIGGYVIINSAWRYITVVRTMKVLLSFWDGNLLS